ncbi:sigma-54-dependent Fis family transcriptional regulator [Spongiibacter sp. KMU-166]|uniref:Sigma-54-dependent Fis family transcriptional regulator n=1 Tax=Spongiibacter thalassae TaxID=2721624 RepID=A0ABX1GC75_9GAMM|nr:sigma-54 dependent transcriptional regulator [Spongiibacter thalassae]NKI16769.1 sigma-54-dependent Fis family transcriptional regulator [Spongiibacter thalassae]
MRQLDTLVSQVAVFDTLVLIRGESGSGKEVVARKLHEYSSRKRKPFIPVNCGAIPADLLESELFGHEKGAFTGAVACRKGRFEMAEGGTLFLDEIGDMSLPMQVKLLRVLQERTYERVGSNESRECNVRILAATHRDLEAMVAEGSFRQDLFFRLDVFPVVVPPLREHPEDIPDLIARFCCQMKERGMQPPILTAAAQRALFSYNWPGNVRELENLVERLCITHGGKRVGLSELPEKYQVSGDARSLSDSANRDDQDALMEALLARPQVSEPPEAAFDALDDGLPPEVDVPGSLLPDGGINLKNHLQELEQRFITEALSREDGVITRAAQLLGLQRTTLAEKMKKLGLA